MSATPTLGNWMDARRAELEARSATRIRWEEFARTIGISRNALLGLRKGTSNPAPATRPHIERAFEWAPKSIDRIDRGEEPVRLEDLAAAQQDVRRATIDDLAGRFVELAREHDDRELLEIMARVMTMRSEGREKRGQAAG